MLKIFRIVWAVRKLNDTNIMRIINANAVLGRLSEKYLTRKIIARNIFDTKYSRTTVYSTYYNIGKLEHYSAKPSACTTILFKVTWHNIISKISKYGISTIFIACTCTYHIRLKFHG